MSRIAYVNGQYVRHSEAAVHVEDRGFQFADGVYEVCEVRHGMIVDLTRHLNRLDRSLSELRMASPMSRAALTFVIREVLRRNRVKNGIFYMQVTRGAARRDHYFPADGTPPTITITAKSTDPSAAAKKYASGIKVITLPENRWDRVDIKTVGLLPNVLAKQQAKEAGAQDAIFIDGNGIVMEGASSNVWIVTPDGELVTRPAEHGILKESPARRSSTSQGSSISRSSSASSGRKRCWPPARCFSPPPPGSACRSSKSTESPSPTAIRALCRQVFATPFSTLRKRRRFDSQTSGKGSTGRFPVASYQA